MKTKPHAPEPHARGDLQVGGDGTRSGWLTDDASALPSMLRALTPDVGTDKDAHGAVRGTEDGDSSGDAGEDGDGDEDGVYARNRATTTAGALAPAETAAAAGVHEGCTAGARRARAAPAPEVDWRTAHFQPGDVAVLAIDTVHMSAANCSAHAHARAHAHAHDAVGSGGGGGPLADSGCRLSATQAISGGGGTGAARVRVSCDTRWQPSREPTDPRVRLWRRRARHGGGGITVVNQLRVDGREAVML